MTPNHEINFTELCVTSNFSFLQGGSHPEELVAQAKALGYRSIALTDEHSLAGVVRAHTEAKAQGLRLIVGARIRLLETLPTRAQTEELTPAALMQEQEQNAYPFSLFLYPTSRAAYGKLSQLLTLGKRRAPKGSCWLQLEDLAEFQEGLYASVLLHRTDSSRLRPCLEQLKDIFTDKLSLALYRHYSGEDEQMRRAITTLSKLTDTPLSATNHVLYHANTRRRLQDVLTCIRHGKTVETAGFLLTANAERYLKTPQEMSRLFRRNPQALLRSSEIAAAASQFSLDEISYQYPEEICPKGITPLEHLKSCTAEGARHRYPEGIPEAVCKQLSHEFTLVDELGYAKYFLTVHDIVSFARSQKILCQGRGAAANSAICYCLGITAVPPDKIDLLVERFISKERNEPPDIDVDFEHERREEVIQYIYRKFGRHRAALVSEVVSYRTKSAVREVGKAMGLSDDSIQTLQRLLRNESEEKITARSLRAAGLNPEEPAVRHSIILSRTIRGFPRHLSQHVGGFVISDEDLSSIVPIENAAMENRTIIEWDKDDIEQMGMLKIDVLALGMLTCIRKALGYVSEGRGLGGGAAGALPSPLAPPLPHHRTTFHEFTSLDPPTSSGFKELLIHDVPAEDPAVYDMICKADTVGVFQIESRAQMTMLPRLRPRCFYDLVIEVAIIRPGPIQGGMVHPYLRRRNGIEPVSFPDKSVKKILHRTLGVPIFQEQVMELAVVAAGFTPGEADELRRAMASWKRNKNLMQRFGMRLVGGMLERGYTLSFAKQVFNQIKGFSEYGFPQSHAASFALLVYVSSWLKCHHPAAFAAALLNSQPMGFYHPSQIIQDAQRHGVGILPIDVNHSAWDSTLERAARSAKHPALRIGMRQVKGLRKTDAKKIVAAVRTHGRYDSVLRLWRESGARVQSLKALARADAFQSFGLARQDALWQIKKLHDEPLPLFDGIEEREPELELPRIAKDVQVMSDYEATGHSLKAHPMSFLRSKLDSYAVVTAEELKDRKRHPAKSKALVSGIVLVRQRPGTASGVVFITTEDETGFANLIVKPEIFRRFRSQIVNSSIIIACGQVQRDGEVVHLLAEEIVDLSGGQETLERLSRNFH